MESDIKVKLLQYVSINCVCYEEMLLSYYHSIAGEENKSINAKEIIKELNEVVLDLNLTIKRCRSEVDGSWYYGIVNEYPAESTITNLHLSPQSLRIFFCVLKLMVQSDGYLKNSSLKEHNAPEIKDCSNENFQYCLNELVLYSYLKPYEDGYTLGDKALLDLKSTLNQIFPENIYMCELCKDIVILNVKCTQCDKRMHKHCCERINKTGNSFCSLCIGSEIKIEGVNN